MNWLYFQLIASMPTPRRVVLTGTPIQNDLQEFFSIVEFCNPGLLGMLLDPYINYFQKVSRTYGYTYMYDIYRKRKKKIETIWSWKMSTFSKYLFSFKMKVHVGLTTGFFFVRIFWIIQKSVWKSYRCLPSTKCFAWRYWIGSREREWTQSYYETICSSAISRNQYQIPAS